MLTEDRVRKIVRQEIADLLDEMFGPPRHIVAATRTRQETLAAHNNPASAPAIQAQPATGQETN